MKKNAGRIAIYSRKSKFTGKGESIGNQVELCREYIRCNFGQGDLDQIDVFEDEGFSGGNLQRPNFQKMMKGIRDRKYKAIVVYRLDRISRNISDFTGLVDELTKLDVSFVSIREQFDTSTPMGRAMMFIISVFSQLERETIAERIRDNMHELAKTGRWLGGNCPTGYTSESVTNVTVDGKTKKACKLKLIDEEAEIVRTIFDLYCEYDSLTMTETELLRRQMQSKNGKEFTRFSIKAILQNPVYMMADEAAYHYFVRLNADLHSELSAFDGKHGIMAYNRTDQTKGKGTVFLPVEEWIIAVGAHPGIVTAEQWIKVQESLERNKSKAYHKPRNNEALLTGLLFCSCGDRMYPKMTKRKTADGDVVYTYVCKRKERSKRSLCNLRNASGNALDAVIVDQIKQLVDSDQRFLTQMEKSRQFYTGNREQYEAQLTKLRSEVADNERKINGLVDSMIDLGDSSARQHVAKRIEQLGAANQDLNFRIKELEGLTSNHALDEDTFDLLRQLLTVFKNGIDDMTVEQKRAAIRTLVRKVVWDGEYAHVVLFGAEEGELDGPDLTERYHPVADEEDEENLQPFADVDYEDDCTSGGSKNDWGEDSK